MHVLAWNSAFVQLREKSVGGGGILATLAQSGYRNSEEEEDETNSKEKGGMGRGREALWISLFLEQYLSPYGLKHNNYIQHNP